MTAKTSKITKTDVVELRAGHLDDAQLARAEALDRARSATKQTGAFGSSAAEPYGLIDVATWILNGRDPLDVDHEPEPSTFIDPDVGKTSDDQDSTECRDCGLFQTTPHSRHGDAQSDDQDSAPQPAHRIEFWDMRDWTKYGHLDDPAVKVDDGSIGIAVYGDFGEDVFKRAEHTMLRIGKQAWRVERVELHRQARVNVTARRYWTGLWAEPADTIDDPDDGDQIGSVTA